MTETVPRHRPAARRSRAIRSRRASRARAGSRTRWPMSASRSRRRSAARDAGAAPERRAARRARGAADPVAGARGGARGDRIGRRAGAGLPPRRGPPQPSADGRRVRRPDRGGAAAAHRRRAGGAVRGGRGGGRGHDRYPAGPGDRAAHPHRRAPTGPAAPTETETALEIPWRLQLSPHSRGAFAHALHEAEHDGRIELWHSRLATRTDGPADLDPASAPPLDEARAAARTVRAVWTRDFRTPEAAAAREAVFPSEDFGNPATLPPFRASLTVRDRMQLVHLTSNHRWRGTSRSPRLSSASC